MANDQEIEAKFCVTDPALPASLRRARLLVGKYPLSAAVEVVHVDTYYDTADLRLLRAGQSLRVRTQGNVLVVTMKSIGLKAPRGMHTREEIERPAPDVAADAPALLPAQLPAEVADALQESASKDPVFLPICRLHQVRRKRMVMRTRGRKPSPSDAFAELSLDEVIVLRPAPDGDGWLPVARFDELEVELTDDTARDELRTLAGALRDWNGLEANEQNKLQQALLALGAASPGERLGAAPANQACAHMAELCRDVWREQLAVMVVNEAGVRDSDDIEYVHDMRVATRRARAAAQLYADFFARRSKRVRRFVERLRSTGRLLGRVRDMDVALDKLARYGEFLDDDARDGLEDLADLWRARRNRNHAALLEWLDSGDYRRFVRDWNDFCNTPGAAVQPFAPVAGEPPVPHQVRHVIPSMILNRYETIRAFEVLFEGKDEVPVETLHALRIECKYLRYHLEFNAGLLGDDGAELIATLKGLQEHLGDLNDASVSAAMLDGARHKVDSPAIARYHALQEAQLEEMRRRLPGDIALFLGEETRRKLVLALARI